MPCGYYAYYKRCIHGSRGDLRKTSAPGGFRDSLEFGDQVVGDRKHAIDNGDRRIQNDQSKDDLHPCQFHL